MSINIYYLNKERSQNSNIKNHHWNIWYKENKSMKMNILITSTSSISAIWIRKKKHEEWHLEHYYGSQCWIFIRSIEYKCYLFLRRTIEFFRENVLSKLTKKIRFVTTKKEEYQGLLSLRKNSAKTSFLGKILWNFPRKKVPETEGCYQKKKSCGFLRNFNLLPFFINISKPGFGRTVINRGVWNGNTIGLGVFSPKKVFFSV